MAPVLIVAPLAGEFEPLLRHLHARGHPSAPFDVGRITCAAIPSLDMLVAVGGHGKAQYAAQTQYLISRCPDATALVCIGAAGRLAGPLAFGDVVVSTTTIEHDFRTRFSPRPPPRHLPDPKLLDDWHQVARRHTFPFRLHFGAIASGDEDVIDPARAQELHDATGALCVAWEGSGGARAAALSGLGFLELRCITDGADHDAVAHFRENLERVMPNVADALIAWRSSPSEGAAITDDTRSAP